MSYKWITKVKYTRNEGIDMQIHCQKRNLQEKCEGPTKHLKKNIRQNMKEGSYINKPTSASTVREHHKSLSESLSQLISNLVSFSFIFFHFLSLSFLKSGRETQIHTKITEINKRAKWG